MGQILELKDIAYANILRNISLTWRQGERIALMGANGSGKTTLAQLITRQKLENPHSSHPQIALIGAHPRRQVIGATVGEELAFALVNQGLSPEEIRQRVSEALESLGLKGKENQSPYTLSGGERQRLVTAAMLAADYPFIIFDESLSMLDAYAQRQMYSYILAHAHSAGQLWITHDPELALKQERLLLIKNGRLIEAPDPEQALSDRKLCQEFGIAPYPHTFRAFYGRNGTSNQNRQSKRFEEGSSKPIVHWEQARFTPNLLLNATIYPNQVIAVLGRSGSGKTTLLESIVGWQKPLTGTVNIDVDGRIGFLLQEAGEYLIDGLEHISPERLSGGERQIIALNSVLTAKPALLLLDEPLLGLDGYHKTQILDRLEQLKQESNITMIYVTHDLEEILQLADRVWLLAAGKIELDFPISVWETYKEQLEDSGVRIPGSEVFTAKPILIDNPSADNPVTKQNLCLSSLDPRLKLVALMILSLIIGMAPVAGLVISSLFIGILFAITPKLVIPWKAILIPVVILSLFYAFLLGWQGYSGISFWQGHLDPQGLADAGVLSWKIALIFGLTILLISSTSYVEQGLAINWVLSPLSRLKRSGDLALLIMLTLRFIPLLKEEFIHLGKARLAKGPLERGILGKLREGSRLLIPLMRLTLRRAEEVSENLMTRGYNPGCYRSYLQFNWKRKDSFALGLLTVWSVILVGIILLI